MYKCLSLLSFRSFSQPNGGTDYDARVNKGVGILVGFGFGSLLFNYLYYACFATSAERQHRKMR